MNKELLLKHKQKILLGIAFVLIPGSSLMVVSYYGIKRLTKWSKEYVQTKRSQERPISDPQN